ncbi:MAG: hypothetical protein JXA14_00620 [Anaerolineae bacterium]|nr:hypothetical protein [Anaerolineae bacterium]
MRRIRQRVERREKTAKPKVPELVIVVVEDPDNPTPEEAAKLAEAEEQAKMGAHVIIVDT